MATMRRTRGRGWSFWKSVIRGLGRAGKEQGSKGHFQDALCPRLVRHAAASQRSRMPIICIREGHAKSLPAENRRSRRTCYCPRSWDSMHRRGWDLAVRLRGAHDRDVNICGRSFDHRSRKPKVQIPVARTPLPRSCHNLPFATSISTRRSSSQPPAVPQAP
ncbi:hypothetical protein BD311DRAFT_48098 [Dichomitus squalens]|uniref:Uncharacterized protein n=1 Tax=Dichomitus squalens TaxID=114155 RepID=A0A4V6MVT4_9APHY|nr:hypothetical protein BD311DRAFT_48098 [Dichomitus squalens]